MKTSELRRARDELPGCPQLSTRAKGRGERGQEFDSSYVTRQPEATPPSQLSAKGCSPCEPQDARQRPERCCKERGTEDAPALHVLVVEVTCSSRRKAAESASALPTRFALPHSPPADPAPNRPREVKQKRELTLPIPQIIPLGRAQIRQRVNGLVQRREHLRLERLFGQAARGVPARKDGVGSSCTHAREEESVGARDTSTEPSHAPGP